MVYHLSQVLDGPEVALLNGQQVHVPVSRLVRGTVAVDRMQMQSVVSDDRRIVRLTAVAAPETTSHEVRSGDTLAMEITRLVGAEDSSRRSFVLVTAEVVIAEEEEERVGAVKRRSELR